MRVAQAIELIAVPYIRAVRVSGCSYSGRTAKEGMEAAWDPGFSIGSVEFRFKPLSNRQDELLAVPASLLKPGAYLLHPKAGGEGFIFGVPPLSESAKSNCRDLSIFTLFTLGGVGRQEFSACSNAGSQPARQPSSGKAAAFSGAHSSKPGSQVSTSVQPGSTPPPQSKRATTTQQHSSTGHAEGPERFYVKHRDRGIPPTGGFRVITSYSEGWLIVTPNGNVEYECTRADPIFHRCERGRFPPIKDVELYEGGLRISLVQGGHWDFFGRSADIHAAYTAILPYTVEGQKPK